MSVCNVSIRRPISTIVLMIFIVLFGYLNLKRIGVREYPNIEIPTISISTTYTGASAGIVETKITIGTITIDCESYLVKKGDTVLELSKKEYELLAFLAKNSGKVYSRDELISAVWGYDPTYGDQRTVDVTIARLRKKVDDPDSGTSLIQTKHGMGYFISKD